MHVCVCILVDNRMQALLLIGMAPAINCLPPINATLSPTSDPTPSQQDVYKTWMYIAIVIGVICALPCLCKVIRWCNSLHTPQQYVIIRNP